MISGTSAWNRDVVAFEDLDLAWALWVPARARARLSADISEITTLAWTPLPLTLPIDAGFWPVRRGIFPEQRRALSRSPIDTKLTFSVGRSEHHARLDIEGGVAGAVWRVVDR